MVRKLLAILLLRLQPSDVACEHDDKLELRLQLAAAIRERDALAARVAELERQRQPARSQIVPVGWDYNDEVEYRQSVP
jgi:hypothetical protein